MTLDRVFLDTSFIVALLNRRDRYHPAARNLWPAVIAAREVWVTHAVLAEVANALSQENRQADHTFITTCRSAPNVTEVPVDEGLFDSALALYASRSDKDWGLTDCISFTVMEANELRDALTADRHFVQAGYRALLLEPR